MTAPAIEIINGSCLDFDLSWAPEFRLLDCDPPYSEHVHSHAVSAGMCQYGIGPRKRDLGFASCSPELRGFIAKAAAGVNGWSLIYSDVRSGGLWADACEAAGAEMVRLIPWIRWTQPQKSGDRPCSGCELVGLYYGARPDGGRMRWNGPGSLVAFEYDDEGAEDFAGNLGMGPDHVPDLQAFRHKSLRQRRPPAPPKHETEKPLDQALDQVSWFTDPGDMVLDLTAGRATVGLACALLGRGFLGYEMQSTEAAAGRVRCEGGLSGHIDPWDLERARRFCEAAVAEASAIPAPKDKSQVRTWERAQRRLADVDRVSARLGL